MHTALQAPYNLLCMACVQHLPLDNYMSCTLSKFFNIDDITLCSMLYFHYRLDSALGITIP